jgi:hypothetical protein
MRLLLILAAAFLASCEQTPAPPRDATKEPWYRHDVEQLYAMNREADQDDLYGRMLFSNHHYGWARLLFQKNLSRWKHWQPQTPETARLLKQAESAIAECDRHILE